MPIYKEAEDGRWNKFTVTPKLIKSTIEKYETDNISTNLKKPIQVFRLNTRYRWENKFKQRMQYPRGVAVDPYYTIWDGKDGDESMSGTYRWCSAPPFERNGEMVFNPPSLMFEDGKSIYTTQQEMEFFFFLYLHPDRENSPFIKDNSSSMFYLENKAKDASLRVKNSQIKARVTTLIYDSNLTEIKLRDYAKGCGIQNVDNMDSLDEVQVALEDFAMSNPEDFFKRITSKNFSMRVKIQKLTEKGVLKLNSDTWEANISGGKKMLIRCLPGQNQMDIILKYFLEMDGNKDNLWEQLDIMIPDSEEEKEKKELTQSIELE